MQPIASYRVSDDALQKEFDNLFFEKFWNKKANKEVYKWINEDNGVVIVSGKSFWIEKYNSHSSYPNAKAFDSMRRFCSKLGFEYLYS